MPPIVVAADGVPLGPGDVCVSDGSARQIVLARATLDADSYAADALQRFCSAPVEADFVLFMHPTRTPLIIIASLELLISTTYPHDVPSWFVGLTNAARVSGIMCFIGAVLLTDGVTACVARRCPRAAISRARRARAHELLFSLLLVLTLVHILRSVFDPVTRVPCPARPGATCDVVGFGDSTKFLQYIVLAPVRLACVVAMLPLLLVVAIGSQLANVFGPQGAPFFNVARSELAGRVVLMVLEYAVATLVTAVRERRLRHHFTSVVGMALAHEQRRQAGLQLAALQQLTMGSDIAACHGSDVTLSHDAASVHDGATLANPLEGGTEMDQRAPHVIVGECIAAWIELRPIPFADDAPSVSARYRTESELCEHAEALHAVLSLASRGAEVVACAVVGDAVYANSSVVSDDASAAEDWEAAAVAVCHYAHSVVDAVRRIADTTPLWHGCVAARAAIAVGDATVNRNAQRIHPWSPVLAAARLALASAPPVQWSIVATRDAMHAVAGTYAPTSVSTIGDSTLFTLATVPVPSDTTERPVGSTTVSEGVALLEASGNPAVPVAPINAIRGGTWPPANRQPTRTAAQLDNASQLRVAAACCGGGAVCRTFFPQFADDGVEADFVDHDNVFARPLFVACGAVTCAAVAVFALLALASAHTSYALLAIAAVAAAASLGTTLLVQQHPLTTQSRAVAGLVFAVAVLGTFAASVWLAPGSQATRDAMIVAGIQMEAAQLVMPQPSLWRWGALALQQVAYISMAIAWYPPGHVREAQYIGVGAVFACVIAILATRAARAQFADVRHMEALVVAARRSELAADRALRSVLPPFVTAALREAPDTPLHRPFVSSSALVFVCEPDTDELRDLMHSALLGGYVLGGDAELQQLAVLRQRLLTMLAMVSIDDVTPREVELHEAHRHCTAHGDALVLVEFDMIGVSRAPRFDVRAHRMLRDVRRFVRAYAADVGEARTVLRDVRPHVVPNPPAKAARAPAMGRAPTHQPTSVVPPLGPCGHRFVRRRGAHGRASQPAESPSGESRSSEEVEPRHASSAAGTRCVLHAGALAGSVPGAATPRSFSVCGPALATAHAIVAAAACADHAVLVTGAVPLPAATIPFAQPQPPLCGEVVTLVKCDEP